MNESDVIHSMAQLRKYVRHADGCKLVFLGYNPAFDESKCTCGLHQVMQDANNAYQYFLSEIKND